MKPVLFDMHSHILPGFDDGARDEEESIALLKMASEQGVKAMVCSSHYYPKESVYDYIQRRKKAVERLKMALQQGGFPMPKLYLGAEVAWFPGVSGIDNIRHLCIAKTPYMLIEPPFEVWTESFYNDLFLFTNVMGITPIIAHLERYLDIQDKKRISRLLEMDVKIQMNAEFILSSKNAGTARKMLKKGYVHLLGSDCHSTDGRPENLGEAAKLLEKWRMEEVLEQIQYNSAEILNFELSE